MLYLNKKEIFCKGDVNMDLTGFIQFISQVGFPIAVASYSLVVLNKTVQKNTEVMTRIAVKLDIETDSKEA
jgi:hypothetical protein